MEISCIAVNLTIIASIAFWREKYGPHIRAEETSTTLDSRIRDIQRWLVLFQVLNFLGVSLDSPETDKIGLGGTSIRFVLRNISAFGAQALMEIILMVAAQFVVKYDEKSSEASDRLEANEILKESLDACGADLIQARKDNSNLQNRISILKDEIENESARNKILENIIDTKNKDIYRLYNRLDDVKDEKKEITKKLLEIIESNSKHIPEGDYIILMDLLKGLYE
jgi:hypothetical protein